MESKSLRKLSSKVERKNPVVEMKGMTMVPHYQWPTVNSSIRAREKFKPSTQITSLHLTKGRCSSLGFVSVDASENSRLLGFRTSEKNPMQSNVFKPSKFLEKTALKIDGLKPSRVSGFLKPKPPKSGAHRVEPHSRRAHNSMITPVLQRGHCDETGHGVSEAKSSLKDDGKEQDGCISSHVVSDVCAHDLIEQSGSCQYMHDQSEDTKQQCFDLINALGDSGDGLHKDEAVEEHHYVSASAGAEMASGVHTDDHTKQFVGSEDDQVANGRQGNEITELDINKCDESYSSCSGYGNSNTEVDSQQKFRQGSVYSLDNLNSEAEKVDLRHRMSEERRATHEWMLDYALTNIVQKLTTFRERKVKLLVEAFEAVTPPSKRETELLQDRRAFLSQHIFKHVTKMFPLM